MEETRLIIKSADLTMIINNINNVPTGQMTDLYECSHYFTYHIR